VRNGKESARDGEIPAAVLAELLSRVKGTARKGGGAAGRILIGDGYAAGWHPAPGGGTVVAVRPLTAAETARIREIAKAYDEYHQVRLLDDPIRASYLGVLILITLLIVFAASWMGIHLARQITVPVQLLAEGTEQVARGDLDVSLDYRSDDEFGTLVTSFNRMTGDLKAMKGSLEQANASLRQTYEELRRRTQFIETILDSISTGVVVIDRHGRIAMINKLAERLLGIPTDQAVGRLYREVVEEEHYEAIRDVYREAGEEAGGQVERQVELMVKGRKVAFRVSLTALRDDAGEYMGLVAAFDDLSQAMRLQRVLAWREVARRIAHDIRNPLTPIQLSTERMQRKYAEEHAGDPVFAECTQVILSEVATLKHLVEEFSRFARMPAPRLAEGDFAEEARSVVETYRVAHPGIGWEFHGEAMPPVWFDPFQMRRAVTNLLENAAFALGGKGRVVVTCAHDALRKSVRLVVADDGPGVPPEDRDRLFEPYFSRKEGGTGLGLAIVSAIANDHGGTVRMRDNQPRGAVFELEFPAQPEGKG
jgi:two-component system nitrogen regulation sensor histidine kinase NtrY